MRDFSTMKANVGADIQDTSSSMGAIIGRYINKRYLDILRVANIQPINSTFSMSITSLATLPADFGKELSCLDSNGTAYTRIDLEEVARITPSDIEYAIFTDQNGAKQIKIWNTTSQTLNLPYRVRPVALSATTDTPLIPCEDAIEAGATADAWRYKRQFQKAQAMEAVYADLTSNLIWDDENQPAYPRQFTPTTYNRDNL
jgi:hypothetical protein